MNLDTLNDRLETIHSNFDYINHGGCAYMAGFLARALLPQFPNIRITTCDDWRDNSNLSIDDLRDELGTITAQECYAHDIGFAHVWVEVEVDGQMFAIDSTGVHTVEDMYRRWSIPAAGSFTIKEIERIAEGNSWNPTFNAAQLPDIEAMVEADIAEAIKLGELA